MMYLIKILILNELEEQIFHLCRFFRTSVLSQPRLCWKLFVNIRLLLKEEGQYSLRERIHDSKPKQVPRITYVGPIFVRDGSER